MRSALSSRRAQTHVDGGRMRYTWIYSVVISKSFFVSFTTFRLQEPRRSTTAELSDTIDGETRGRNAETDHDDP